MTELDGLRLERDGDIATITLDVPEKLNRLSMPTRDQLAQLFAQLGGDTGVRAIVLTGEKLAQLELVQFVSQTVMFGRHFFLRLRAMRRIAFFGSEFLQRAEIFDLAFQLLERIDQRTQSRNFLDISLGALPI